MPGRKPADKDLVVATWERLGNARATARELGFNEATVYRILRVARGKCSHCVNPVEPGRQYCKKCLAKLAERDRTRNAERIKARICRYCDLRVEYPSRTVCAEHFEKHRESAIKSAAKAPRVPYERQRLADIRQHYGSGGVEKWQEQEGKCEICGCDRTQRQIAIHHLDLDRNHRDNSKENLAVLCKDCHAAVHLLAEVTSVESLVTWMQAKYPHR